jgi:hypothetical protein
MSRKHKPDPYDGFKSDIERRRALNFRYCCVTVICVTLTLSYSAKQLKPILKWITALAK